MQVFEKVMHRVRIKSIQLLMKQKKEKKHYGPINKY